MATLKPQTDEDEYRQATKTVVDDAMRTDILGPNLVRVLEDHKPANDLLKQIVCGAISNDPEIKTALGNFVEDHYTKRKGKWVDRIIWLAVGAVITGVVAYFLSIVLRSKT